MLAAHNSSGGVRLSGCHAGARRELVRIAAVGADSAAGVQGGGPGHRRAMAFHFGWWHSDQCTWIRRAADCDSEPCVCARLCACRLCSCDAARGLASCRVELEGLKSRSVRVAVGVGRVRSERSPSLLGSCDLCLRVSSRVSCGDQSACHTARSSGRGAQRRGQCASLSENIICMADRKSVV